MRLSSYINKIERFENKGTINVGDDKRKTGFSVGIGVQKNNIFNNPIPAPAEDFDKNKFGSGYIGKVKNSGIINVYGTANTAMKLYIDGPGGIAAEKKLKYNANVITNAGIINLYGTRNLGMYASDGGDADVMGPPPDYKFTRFFTMSRVTNKGTINVNGAGNVAMSAGSAIVLNQAINLEDGTINLKGKNNIGCLLYTSDAADD